MATTPRHIVRPQRVHGAYVLDTVTGAIRAGLTTPGARQIADRLNQQAATAPTTYAVRGAALKTTGHYRRPGTPDLYCGRPAGGQNGIFATVNGWKLCTRCATAEAADRAAAATVAEQHREDTTAEPAAAATWRSDWISATDDTALFTLPTPTEQGALFA
ncbi:hypothetical protein ACWGRF_02020 [Streptomyces zhihengii]